MRLPSELWNALRGYAFFSSITSIDVMNGGLDNEKYVIGCLSGDHFVIKLFRIKNNVEIMREVRALVYLAENGARVQTPIPQCSGEYVFFVGGRFGCVFKYIVGFEPRPTADNLKRIGASIASVHNISPLGNLRSGYTFNANDVKELIESRRHVVEHDVRDFFVKCLSAVSKIDWIQSDFRMCHCDIFIDNLVESHAGEIYIIDFEEISIESVIFDLGRAVVGCCRNGDVSPQEMAMILRSGYESERPLSRYDSDNFDLGVIYAGMISTYWRYVAFEIERIDTAKMGVYRELMHFTSSYLDSVLDKASIC